MISSIIDDFESREYEGKIRLSDILDICYNLYGFDYVTIFDFACRSSDITEMCTDPSGRCCQPTCITCDESGEEIRLGKRLLDKIDLLQLGGGKTRRRRFLRV
jgi:hypothetical protein